MTQSRRILVIGAGGGMTGRFLASLDPLILRDYKLDLRDIDPDAAAKAAKNISGIETNHGQLDLYDAESLNEAMEGAYLVVNGAGPYHTTAMIVRRSAIQAGAHYLDIDDDTESALDSLQMESDAKDRSVSLFIGCGASPGLTNVMASELLEHLDETFCLDVLWCVGDERNQTLGRSVLAHTLHMGAGRYECLRDGKLVRRESYAVSRKFNLPELSGQPFYECAHPEPVMFAHSFPHLANATCWGTLHPAPLNGIIKGVARALKAEELSSDEAITFLQRSLAGKKTDTSANRIATRGVLQQLRAREISPFQYLDFLLRTALGVQWRTISTTAAIATGLKDGKKCEVIRHINTADPESPLKHMDVTTGCSQAAFVHEALTTNPRSGVLYPEQWISPQRFYARLGDALPGKPKDWLSPIKWRFL